MRGFAAALGLALIAGGAAATPVVPPPDAIPGKPQQCLPGTRFQDFDVQPQDDGAIVWRQNSHRWWVNRSPSCASMVTGRRRVSRISPSGQPCRGEIVQISDRLQPIVYGSCALGDFVPYEGRRP